MATEDQDQSDQEPAPLSRDQLQQLSDAGKLLGHVGTKELLNKLRETCSETLIARMTDPASDLYRWRHTDFYGLAFRRRIGDTSRWQVMEPLGTWAAALFLTGCDPLPDGMYVEAVVNWCEFWIHQINSAIEVDQWRFLKDEPYSTATDYAQRAHAAAKLLSVMLRERCVLDKPIRDVSAVDPLSARELLLELRMECLKAR